MTETSVKPKKIVDNTAWKERHQFVLSANGNIICQRYFKVNGFNPTAHHSVEFVEAAREVVNMIKQDLASKSRIYMSVMNSPTKLTGFYSGMELDFSDACLAHSLTEGETQLSNGMVLDKTYFEHEGYDEEIEDAPFEFKFAYLFDDKVLFEEVWDGKIYPKYVRNSIDLSNSDASYRYVDPMRMTLSQQMVKYFTRGKKNLINEIIKSFCAVLSNEVGVNGKSIDKNYTRAMEYGNKTYHCDNFPREWANAVRQKTIQYKRWVEWDLPQSKLDAINKK